MSELRTSVKVQLVGGLGNQLFCYAFGRFLESKGHRVIFDTSEVDRGYTQHGVFLESLEVPGEFRNLRTEFGKLRYFFRRFSFAIQARLKFNEWPSWASPCYTADSVGWSVAHEEAARAGITMRGYFASYRYYEQVLKHVDFNSSVTPRAPSEYFLSKKHDLAKDRWIAVHLRRGDYVGLKDLYGLCGVDYFRKAFEAVKSSGSFSRVVVFSDDVKQATKLLAGVFDLPTEFVMPPNESGAEESLLLMSLASAHIISNSSFSLWAALLSVSSEVVTVPHPWHKGMDTPNDLFPPSWKPIGADF
jgi:hypothetical protein